MSVTPQAVNFERLAVVPDQTLLPTHKTQQFLANLPDPLSVLRKG